jgi:putative SOS response-associated peptidase YedK
MCGRVQQDLSWSEIVDLYRLGIEEEEENNRPFTILNGAPTQRIGVIIPIDGARHFRRFRWGFPKSWLPDPWTGQPLINAKAEEAANRATWKKAIRERRCLVPTTGFYEWLTISKKEKYPLWFRPTDGRALTLAGPYGVFEKEGVETPCFSILTTAANEDVSDIHDRMPVILGEADWDRWLSPQTPFAEITPLLGPSPAGTLTSTEVSTLLGKSSEKGAEVLEPDWDRAQQRFGSALNLNEHSKYPAFPTP